MLNFFSFFRYCFVIVVVAALFFFYNVTYYIRTCCVAIIGINVVKIWTKVD